MAADDIKAWLHLYRAPGLGYVGLNRLLEYYGDVTAILAQSKFPTELQVPASVKQYLKQCSDDDLKSVLSWLEKPDNHIIPVNDAVYPPQLKATDDPPILLFVKGRIEALLMPQLAVVGSRRATQGGLDNGRAFCYDLAKKNWVITSGLAAGVDAAAHQAALDAGGLTVAVMGTGINAIYPKSNQQLAKDIIAQGAVITEFDFNTPPQANNFPRRNRIIAGLSLGTLVVEAGQKSGTLITARLTNEINRPVMAIPGSIHNPMAKGCHWLIKQGAVLVESADDILHELKPGMSMLSDQIRRRLQEQDLLAVENNQQSPDMEPTERELKNMDLTDTQQIIMDHLGYDPTRFDALVATVELDTATVSSDLLLLELHGLVTKLPGTKYQKR